MRRLTAFTALLASVAGAGCGGPVGDRGPSLPTFNRDIAPIVWARCGGCHRPAGIGPFSLLTYDEVRSQSRKIVSVTKNHIMPPWLPEPGYGEFTAARRLSEADVQMFERWSLQGAPEGATADRHSPPAWSEGWQLGRPDLIVELGEPYVLRPGESDVFRNVVMPIPIDRTRYVRGMEVRPGNSKVVHHATIGIDRTHASRRLDEESVEPGFPGGMFSESTSSPDNHALGWTPGMTPVMEPADMAWRLDQGADLVVQLHLLPSRSGVTETVRPSIGFFFTDTPPTRASIDFKLGLKSIDIPAGQSDYVGEDTYQLPVDVDVVSIYPHAHYLGKDMKAFATLPGGDVKWLLWITRWDFHWQDQYRYATPVFLPKGSIVTMRYTYDNSDGNAHNPSHPPKRVVYGPQSSDEMGDLWLRLVPRTAEGTRVLARSFVENEGRKDVLAAEQRVAADPSNAIARSVLGGHYVQAGRIEEGVAQLEEALRLDRRSVEAHNNLGHAFQILGKPGDAVAQFREAARLGPRNDVVQLNLANALQDEGAIDEAIGHYRAALAINAESADAHNSFGTALASKGLLDEAAVHFGRALEIRPDDADAQTNLAQVRALQSERRRGGR